MRESMVSLVVEGTMKVANMLRAGAKSLRRTLRLSPMHKVFRRLSRYGVDPRTFNALEVFGGGGQSHTKDIASVVPRLEIWEILPQMESVLKRTFPQSEIKITDSYVEIQRVPKKYDLVVVDNSSTAFDHYEHFDLFPIIFRVLNDSAVVILNVIPRVRTKHPERLKRRQAFYSATDPTNISFREMADTYRIVAEQNGWTMEQFFCERRWILSLGQDTAYYGVLKLKRQHADDSPLPY